MAHSRLGYWGDGGPIGNLSHLAQKALSSLDCLAHHLYQPTTSPQDKCLVDIKHFFDSPPSSVLPRPARNPVILLLQIAAAVELYLLPATMGTVELRFWFDLCPQSQPLALIGPSKWWRWCSSSSPEKFSGSRGGGGRRWRRRWRRRSRAGWRSEAGERRPTS